MNNPSVLSFLLRISCENRYTNRFIHASAACQHKERVKKGLALKWTPPVLTTWLRSWHAVSYGRSSQYCPDRRASPASQQSRDIYLVIQLFSDCSWVTYECDTRRPLLPPPLTDDDWQLSDKPMCVYSDGCTVETCTAPYVAVVTLSIDVNLQLSAINARPYDDRSARACSWKTCRDRVRI